MPDGEPWPTTEIPKPPRAGRMTYAKAGVDIDRKSASITSLVKGLRFVRKGFGAPVRVPGHFAGLIGFGDWRLALCTDGVGTKLLVAEALKKYDTVGIDCVAMNCNDVICVGAEPLAFVDYIALRTPDKELTSQIGVGLDEGARQANCSIVGGEIAILPEIVNHFDLAGTCLGAVERGKEVTGADIRPGDDIIGLPSSGIHSNGLTLARRTLERENVSLLDRFRSSTVGRELLRPTRIYVRPVLDAVRTGHVVGLANITGGGLRNLVRLKRGVRFEITDPLRPQPVFLRLQELGMITDQEMYQVFNMGMGFCLVVRKGKADEVLETLGRRTGARVVGSVVAGEGVTVPRLRLRYERY